MDTAAVPLESVVTVLALRVPSPGTTENDSIAPGTGRPVVVSIKVACRLVLCPVSTAPASLVSVSA